MKKSVFIIICLIFILTTSASAQENPSKIRNQHLGITISSFGSNDVIYFQQMDGAASYNSDKFYTLGLNYLYKLNRTIDFETGFEYSAHKIIINPNLPPDMDHTPYGAEFSVINIPVTVRINFLKYFFLNSGIFLGIDPTLSSTVDSQTGIGASLGAGFNYTFKCGVSTFINPYTKAHSLIPFPFDDRHQRLLESGFRFGVMYKL